MRKIIFAQLLGCLSMGAWVQSDSISMKGVVKSDAVASRVYVVASRVYVVASRVYVVAS